VPVAERVTLRIARRRLFNERLWGPPAERPEDVIGALGAVQAQDYAGAKWSVGRRCARVTDAGVERALDEGTILRTHVLRPTWHFVRASDIRWILELTRERVHALNAYYYRRLGLDEDAFRRTERLLRRVLRDGNHLTRPEIRSAFEKDGFEAAGVRLAFALMHAELDGIVCNGIRRGNEHTYALLDERAPEAPSTSREEAAAELVRRFFTSHGPATVADLRWWSSLRVSEIRVGLEAAGDALDKEIVGGLTYWSGTDPPPGASPRPAVLLLQGFDEYLVAYSDTKHVFDAAGVRASLPDARVLSTGVLLAGTQLGGHWKRRAAKDQVVVEVTPYRPLTDRENAALRTEGRRLGEFLDVPVRLEVVTP
jgi:hypothetical protein